MFVFQDGDDRMSETDNCQPYSAPVRLASLDRDRAVEALITLALGTEVGPDPSLGYSACHIRRICHECTGEPIAFFIRRLRLERAAGRLTAGDRTITEISGEAKYTTIQAFSKAFAAHFGTCPTEFARSNRSQRAVMPGYSISEGMPCQAEVTLWRSDGKTSRVHYDGPLLLALQRPCGGLSWSWLAPLAIDAL